MMLRHHSVRRRTLARILKEEKLLRPGEEPILGADSLLKMNDLIIDAKARRIWIAP